MISRINMDGRIMSKCTGDERRHLDAAWHQFVCSSTDVKVSRYTEAYILQRGTKTETVTARRDM